MNIIFEPLVKEFVRPELDRLLEEWNSTSVRAHRRLVIIDRFAVIGKTATPILIEALNRENPVNIRKNASRALGEMGDVSAIPALIQLIESEGSSGTSVSGIIALGKIGDSSAVPVLIETIEKTLYKGKRIGEYTFDYQSRRAAATALGRIGDVRAVPILIKALNDINPQVARAAATSLRKIGTPEALGAIEK